MSWVKSTSVDPLTQARSQHWPWYWPSYGEKLTAEGRALLVEDCGVREDEVEEHILHVRDQAWKVFPFPCIGQFWFVEFGISHNPRFLDVVGLLQQPSVVQKGSLQEPSHTDRPAIDPLPASPSSQGEDPVVVGILTNPAQRRLLDIGTCVGQDLRMLRRAGAPTQTLYGTDLFRDFEAVGHALFRDEATFQRRFFAADVMDSSITSPLEVTRGLWDVVSTTMMLHQFALGEQKIIAARMLRLLRPVRGSMLLGSNTGQVEAGELQMKPPFVAEGEEKVVFRQSKETMVQLWEEAICSLGEAKESWRISCEYDLEQLERREAERREKGEVRYFQGEGQRRILFSVERL